MRLTIKLKLVLSFGLVILLSCTMAALGISSLASLNNRLESLIKGPVHRLEMVLEMQGDLLEQNRAEKNVLLADNPQEVARYENEQQVAAQELQQHRAEWMLTGTAAGKEKMALFDRAYQQLVGVQERVRELASQGPSSDARVMSQTQGRPLMQEAKKQLDELVRLNHELLAKADNDAQADYEAARNWLMGAVIVSLLIAVGTAIWISLGIGRGLTKAKTLANAVSEGDLEQNVAVRTNDEIKDLVEAMTRMTVNLRATAQLADMVAAGDLSRAAHRLSEKDALGIALERMVANLRGTAAVADHLANGDLTVTAKSASDKDVLGTALERMVAKLRSVVADALSAADNVSSGSQELSASAQQLSQGSTEQASAGEEASASMEQMAANIKQNADNASQTEKIARQAAKDAEASGGAVHDAVAAMQTIAEKITIVQEIARQTDLLTRTDRLSPWNQRVAIERDGVYPQSAHNIRDISGDERGRGGGILALSGLLSTKNPGAHLL